MAQGKFKLNTSTKREKKNRGISKQRVSKPKAVAKTIKQKILKSLKVSAEIGLVNKIPHSERNRLSIAK